MKYNYIICGTDDDNIKYNYWEAIEDQDVLYLGSPYDVLKKNKIYIFLFRLSVSSRIPEWIKLCSRYFVFYKILSIIIKFTEMHKNTFCFIFYRPWYHLCKNGFLQYLKRNYTSAKFIWIFADIVESYNGDIDIDYIKKDFDLVISFDQDDVKQYGFMYHPEIYPNKTIKNISGYPDCDVIFLGRAKKRLSLILEIYKKLKELEVKAEFFIVDAADDEKQFSSEIHYLKKPMAYNEYLQRLDAAKCILEILQNPDRHGYTTRTSEAIIYGKKLISNNAGLYAASFFNKNYINIIKTANDIDPKMIKNDIKNINYPFKDELSFYNQCEAIEKELEKE